MGVFSSVGGAQKSNLKEEKINDHLMHILEQQQCFKNSLKFDVIHVCHKGLATKLYIIILRN